MAPRNAIGDMGTLSLLQNSSVASTDLEVKLSSVPFNMAATVHGWLLNTWNVSGPDCAASVKHSWILKTWYGKKDAKYFSQDF